MRLRRRSTMPEGEPILPMINVVFLLLIFFMIAGALERADLFRVEPPQAEAGRQDEAGGGVLLIGEGGQLAFDGKPLSRAGLADALRAFQDAHPAAVLKIKADAQAEAVEVVRLLRDVRAAGAGQVVLLASRKAD